MSEEIIKQIVTAEDLLKTAKRHPMRRICRICGEDVSSVGIIYLVYVFESCSCEIEQRYEHLVESLYHRKCFLTQKA